MSDIIDQANQHSDRILELELKAQREKFESEPKLEAVGECHNCFEEVELPKLYCNGECATEHARPR